MCRESSGDFAHTLFLCIYISEEGQWVVFLENKRGYKLLGLGLGF